jgi:hypothetical protein
MRKPAPAWAPPGAGAGPAWEPCCAASAPSSAASRELRCPAWPSDVLLRLAGRSPLPPGCGGRCGDGRSAGGAQGANAAAGLQSTHCKQANTRVDLRASICHLGRGHGAAGRQRSAAQRERANRWPAPILWRQPPSPHLLPGHPAACRRAPRPRKHARRGSGRSLGAAPQPSCASVGCCAAGALRGRRQGSRQGNRCASEARLVALQSLRLARRSGRGSLVGDEQAAAGRGMCIHRSVAVASGAVYVGSDNVAVASPLALASS